MKISTGLGALFPGVALAMALGASSAPAAHAEDGAKPRQEASATLSVVVYGLRSDRGKVGCALFRGPTGFPSARTKAWRGLLVSSRNRAARCIFANVPAGEYALAVLHDENGNGDMDTGVFGIPTEGYGASNDAPARFGPPSYEDARFRLRAVAARMRIRMHY
jgi:uncharacterized protein (DUF2141 family)